MHWIACEFSLIPLGFGIGCVLLWIVSLMRRRPAEAGPKAVSQALTACSLLLMVCGWINFIPQTLSRKWHHDLERAISLALLAGLAVATVAIKTGVRLESRRMERTGTGTPFAAMVKRATFLFSSLTLVVGTMFASGVYPRVPALAAIAGLSALWLPSAIAWRSRPDAGPVEPRRSAAFRATFFGLAISALVSLGVPWLAASEIGIGFLTGVWTSDALLMATAWLAAGFGARTAILLVGLGAGIGGFSIVQSL